MLPQECGSVNALCKIHEFSFEVPPIYKWARLSLVRVMSDMNDEVLTLADITA
jgi:hypothetical protein